MPSSESFDPWPKTSRDPIDGAGFLAFINFEEISCLSTPCIQCILANIYSFSEMLPNVFSVHSVGSGRRLFVKAAISFSATVITTCFLFFLAPGKRLPGSSFSFLMVSRPSLA